MTDNRTAWGDAMETATSAIARAMQLVDEAALNGDGPAMMRLTEAVNAELETTRIALPTVAYGYSLEAGQADQLAEALRLTAEWSMATALPGWSWFDALTSYRDHRGWDVLPATGLPAGITEAEAAEPVWSLTRIRETLDDPFTDEHTHAKAMRMLRWHERREEDGLAAPAEPTAAVYPLPELRDENGAIRGVPFLLEQLAVLARESVYLWFDPMRPQPWNVWTGVPAGTSGGEWGAGATARDALGDAYRRLMAAIFDGRLVR